MHTSVDFPSSCFIFFEIVTAKKNPDKNIEIKLFCICLLSIASWLQGIFIESLKTFIMQLVSKVHLELLTNDNRFNAP